MTAFLGKNEGKWQRVGLAALRNFPLPALLGTLPGVLLLLLVLFTGPGALLAAWGVVSAVLMIVVGTALTTAGAVGLRAWTAIPQNYYGLCTGAPEPATEGRAQSLTYWLTDLLDELAGVKGSGKPLTFGDLWGSDDADASRRINLEMITTSLSHGRPYRLPFSGRSFLFDDADMKKFFPPAIVEWMVEHSYRDLTAPLCQRTRARNCTACRDPADIPVVVATRMSLSFPILLSAVPLYAVDWTREDNRAAKKAGKESLRSLQEGEKCCTAHNTSPQMLVLRWRHHHQPARTLFRQSVATAPDLRHQPAQFPS